MAPATLKTAPGVPTIVETPLSFEKTGCIDFGFLAGAGGGGSGAAEALATGVALDSSGILFISNSDGGATIL